MLSVNEFILKQNTLLVPIKMRLIAFKCGFHSLNIGFDINTPYIMEDIFMRIISR